MADRPSKQERLDILREKLKAMSYEELLALSAVLRRSPAELAEELQVLQEQLIKHRIRRRKNDGGH